MSAPKPGLAAIENELWFAGSISERKAEQILGRLREPGTFLVRISLLPEVDYVLTVSSGTEIWHYDVVILPTNECILNNYKFTDLPSAITFYTENRLGSVFLTEPEAPIISKNDLAKIAAPAIRVAPVAAPPRTSSLIKTTPEPPRRGETEASPVKLQQPTIPNDRLSQSPLNSESSSCSPAPSPNAKHKDEHVEHFVLNTTSETDGSSSTPEPTSSNATQSNEKPDANLEIAETSFDSESTPTSEAGPLSSHNAADGETPASIVKTEPATRPQSSPGPPAIPKRTSSEVKTALHKLPGIKQRQLELEKKLKGEEDETQQIKSPTSTTPKRLAIPETFNDPQPAQTTETTAATSTAAPKRLSIPTALQAMPPPPPLATHPGLAKKKEDEEKQQLLEQQRKEKERKKAEKKKPFGIGKRSSKKLKRSSTFEEPVEADSKPETLESSKEDRRRSSGILIPISPVTKESGVELENAFKHITKHGWNTDDFEPTSTSTAASSTPPNTTPPLTQPSSSAASSEPSTINASNSPSHVLPASDSPSPEPTEPAATSTPSSVPTSTAPATSAPKTTTEPGAGPSSPTLSEPASPAVIAEPDTKAFEHVPLPSSFSVNPSAGSAPTNSQEQTPVASPPVEPNTTTPTKPKLSEEKETATTSVDTGVGSPTVFTFDSSPVYPISTFTSAASPSKHSNSPKIDAITYKPPRAVSAISVTTTASDKETPVLPSSSFSTSKLNGIGPIPISAPTIATAAPRPQTITVSTQHGPTTVPLRTSRPSASPNTRRSTTSFYDVVKGVMKAEPTPRGQAQQQRNFSRYMSSPSIGVANQHPRSSVLQEEPAMQPGATQQQPGVAFNIGPMNTKRKSIKRKGKRK